MARYISNKRLSNVAAIRSGINLNTGEIRQPSRPNAKLGFNNVVVSKIASPPTEKNVTKPIKQPLRINNERLSNIVTYASLHEDRVLPEITSAPSNNPVKHQALIVVSYGAEGLRKKASDRALERLSHANPRPGVMLFIEAVPEGSEPQFNYLKNMGWEYLQLPLTEESAGLFQKEALWNVGADRVFNRPEITQCVFIDCDTAFHDNSWTVIISNSLKSCGFVQPYEAIVYSEQKDTFRNGTPIPSVAYCISSHQKYNYATPGGAFACTKDFYDKILGGAWPFSPVGSGDAQFWRYMFGHVPITCLPIEKEESPYGPFHRYKIGYSKLLLNHYYHGPMNNRMYVTRNYIAQRCGTGREAFVNEHGLLEWSKTIEGRLMKQCMQDLKRSTTSYLAIGKEFKTVETKDMFKRLSKKYFGAIDASSPLYVITSYRENGHITKDRIEALKKSLKNNLKCPYKFIVSTDNPQAFGGESMGWDLPSHLVPVGWEWIEVFNTEFDKNINILYIDPTANPKGMFEFARCPGNKFYISRNRKAWSTKLLYFHSCKKIYEKFYNYVTNRKNVPIEQIYPDPATFLVSQVQNLACTEMDDILIHVDYVFSPRKNDLANFVL